MNTRGMEADHPLDVLRSIERNGYTEENRYLLRKTDGFEERDPGAYGEDVSVFAYDGDTVSFTVLDVPTAADFYVETGDPADIAPGAAADEEEPVVRTMLHGDQEGTASIRRYLDRDDQFERDHGERVPAYDFDTGRVVIYPSSHRVNLLARFDERSEAAVPDEIQDIVDGFEVVRTDLRTRDGYGADWLKLPPREVDGR